MLEQHYIDEAAYTAANNTPITASYHGSSIDVNAPYVAEMLNTVMQPIPWV